MLVGSKSTVRFHNLARRFAQHLIDIGVAAPAQLTQAQIARATLLADYEAYLIKQRGLSPRTIYHTLRFADRFLDHRFGDGVIRLDTISARDVVAFVQHLLTRKKPFRDKTPATHLRNFFRYLFKCGLTSSNLALCIPSVAKRYDARLPRHIAPDQVEALLAAVRAKIRSMGWRDFAMVLFLARLGLRAPEVIAMQLDDIDWRAARLSSVARDNGMIGFLSRLTLAKRWPITSAWIAWTASRALFVTERAPHRAFKDGQVLNIILRDAFSRTSFKPPAPYVGSHVLRHSLATNLVRRGASLDEIGDMLRHRSRASTMIYAKLDIDGLRSIAQPWPVAGGAQ